MESRRRYEPSSAPRVGVVREHDQLGRPGTESLPMIRLTWRLGGSRASHQVSQSHRCSFGNGLLDAND
jgi:hypothetical protein